MKTIFVRKGKKKDAAKGKMKAGLEPKFGYFVINAAEAPKAPEKVEATEEMKPKKDKKDQTSWEHHGTRG